MIRVTIKKDGNRFKSLEVKGHANSGAYGKDLVCAAVSAVVTGGLNNLQELDNYQIKLEEGLVQVKILEDISAHDEVVLETIEVSLKTIEESYGEFIEIKTI